jgi:hypothetical protein
MWCLQTVTQFCNVYCNSNYGIWISNWCCEEVSASSGIRRRDIPVSGTHAILSGGMLNIMLIRMNIVFLLWSCLKCWNVYLSNIQLHEIKYVGRFHYLTNLRKILVMSKYHSLWYSVMQSWIILWSLVMKTWNMIVNCHLSGDWYGLPLQGGKTKCMQHVWPNLREIHIGWRNVYCHIIAAVRIVLNTVRN